MQALVSVPSITISPLQPSDISPLCDLAARIWRAHYVPEIVTAEQIEYMLPRVASPAIIEKVIQEKQQRYWLLRDGNELIGYGACEPREETGHWFLDKLYVETTRHRIGLGSVLLEHIKKELRPSRLSLRVNRKNIKAINFYFKHGFAITAVDVLELGNGYVMDDFLMRWSA